MDHQIVVGKKLFEMADATDIPPERLCEIYSTCASMFYHRAESMERAKRYENIALTSTAISMVVITKDLCQARQGESQDGPSWSIGIFILSALLSVMAARRVTNVINQILADELRLTDIKSAKKDGPQNNWPHTRRFDSFN